MTGSRGGRLCPPVGGDARGAPCGAPRCFFGGVCTCRAGPMCPAEKCVPGGGARGPRPTGQVRYPPVGDGVLDVPSARRCRAGIRIPTPVFALARNDSASRCRGGQSRPPLQVFIGIPVRDAVPYGTGRRGRRPLQFLCGTSRTPSPTGRTPSPTGFYPVISTRVPSLSSTQLS